MSAKFCVSVCEISHLFADECLDFSSFLSSSISSQKAQKCERIYIGSDFCCIYFTKFTLKALEKIEPVLRENGLKVTLCLPIFSQGHLQEGKDTIGEIMGRFSQYIDEICVSDYAMLAYIKDKYAAKLYLGRMMNKDTRDIRYDDYFNVSHKPTVSTLQSSVAKEYGVEGVVLDITNRFLDLSELKMQAAVCYPYVFATTGNICEFASIGLPIEKKFRPNLSCGAACRKVSVSYDTDSGIVYYKAGRTVYFKVSDFTVSGKEDYRLVYQPLDIAWEVNR